MNNHKDIRYYQIPKGVLENRKLSFGAKLVFAIMVNCVNITTKERISASRKYFAFLLDKSERHISRYYDELVNAKVVKKQYITNKYGDKHNFFQIDWEVVKGLEEDGVQSNANLLEETPSSPNIVREPQNMIDKEELPFGFDEQTAPAVYVERPDVIPDWCGQITPEDFSEWFNDQKCPPPGWKDWNTPPPGWFEDTVDPGEPPDWYGKTDPEGFPLKDHFILSEPPILAPQTQEVQQFSIDYDPEIEPF